MTDTVVVFEWDDTVMLDYGQFQLWVGEPNDTMDEMAVLEKALEAGIAQDQSLITVVVPHQNNFAMPLRVEVLSASVADDLEAWDEAFEAAVDVTDTGLLFDSPTMGGPRSPFPPVTTGC